MIQYILELYRLSSIKDNMAKLCENNVVCITQFYGRFVKGDKP